MIDNFTNRRLDFTNNSNFTSNQGIYLGTISHGDIKPGNILLSFKNNIPTIDLTDYGTCGPDEKEDDPSCKYAGTRYYLPKSRWGTLKDEQTAIETLAYKSIGSHLSTDANSTAAKVDSRTPRIHGNADDFYAFGVTLLEFMMGESILTLDP